MEYYKVYIQKMGTDQQGNPFPVKETIADFGIPGTSDEGAYASEFPFKPFADTKELPSNNKTRTFQNICFLSRMRLH